MIDFDEIHNAVTSTFAEPVLYRPLNKPPFLLPHGGVFDNCDHPIDYDTGPSLTIAHPRVGIKESDVATNIKANQGDLVTIRNIDYEITDVRNDSHGWVFLILCKAP